MKKEKGKLRCKIKSLAAHAKGKTYLKRMIFKQDNGKDYKDKTMIKRRNLLHNSSLATKMQSIFIVPMFNVGNCLLF